MNIDKEMLEVDKLLKTWFGISITDVDESSVIRSLQSGHSPQEIVNDIQHENDLEKSETPIDFDAMMNM